MQANLRECTDRSVVYGILEVEMVSPREVQEKINEIKAAFDEEGFHDWTIDDILEQFPPEWDWNFTPDAEYDLEV